LPIIHYIDYSLVTKDFRTHERNLQETKEFIKQVETWSGRIIKNDDLIGSIKIVNEYKQALRDFSALRYGPNSRITGTEAITAIAGSFYLEKDKATTLIRQLAKEAETWDEVKAIKVFYTSSMQENTEVYELFEDCGLNVVSEDKIFGDRYSDRDTDLNISPVNAISKRYHYRYPSSERGTIKERGNFIPQRVTEVGAQALVIFMNHNDESYIWDFPKQKIELIKLGIPVLIIEKQCYPLKNKTILAEKFNEFAKSIF
jgi:benzoyl-CoA reductase/2-hydroxyglutaryl-CoA dehydratase subunit BcrC/BadD/HgdB